MRKTRSNKTFIIYVDNCEYMKFLTSDEVGRLFKAMIKFAQDGTEPEFSEEHELEMIWDVVRSDMERDMEKGAKRHLQLLYASYCAEQKRLGNTPLSREEWDLEMGDSV